MALSTSRATAALLVLSTLWIGCSRDPATRAAGFRAKATKYLAQKDYGRAALELNNAVKVQPNDAQAWYLLGTAYIGSKDLYRAIPALRKATQLDPHLAAAQLRLSELEVQSRDAAVLQDAVQRLDQVLLSDADDPDALDVLAMAELRLNRPEDAVKHLQQALSHFPGHVKSAAALAATQFVRGDFAGAEETLKRAEAADGKSPAAPLALAHIYLLEKKRFEAESALNRALKLDPASSPALLALGTLQTSEGRVNEADRTYRTLAALPGGAYPYVHAAFLLQQGKRAESIAEFEKLAAAAPNDGMATLRLASANFSAGRTADAMRHLDKVLKRNPKDSDALLMRSRMNLASGRPQDAERDIQQVLHLRPDSADAHYGMARADEILGRQGSRKQELAEVIRLAPNLIAPRVDLARALIAEGNPGAALQVLDAAPEALKTTTSFLTGKNWALLALNRIPEVTASVEKGMRGERAPDLLVQRGILESRKKNFAGSQSDAEEALRLKPSHKGALNLAVESYLARKQPELAVALVRQMAAKNAKSPSIQVFAGQWMRRLGQGAEARSLLLAAKALNPTYGPADVSLAALDVGEGKVESAQTILKELLTRQPQNETGHMMLAHIRLDHGDAAGALEQFRAAAELNPENVTALNATAYLLASTDPDGALKFAQRATELAPNDPRVQDTMGWVYYRKGMYTIALEHLQMAVAGQATPVRQFHLAMSYLKIGERAKGQEILNKALAQDPNLLKTEQGW